MPRGNGGPAETPRQIDSIDLHATPGHLLRRAQQRAVELFARAVGDDGLRPPQFAVMLTISQQPGLSQTELVSRTGIDRSTIADMVARLAKKGLVMRRRTAADQRANTLWLTDEGLAALAQAADAVEVAQEDIMRPIPPDQRAGFLALLGLIADLPPDKPA